MTKTNKKGTSLVELLAVIVIMGIIAAIAVPTVGALLKNTRRKAAGADMLTVIQSIDTFVGSANKSDLQTLGVSADHKFSITFVNADGQNEDAINKAKIKLIFDTDTETVDRIAGTIEFTLNSSDNKVASVSFGTATYTKDSHVYSEFNYGSGEVTCKKED